MKKTYEHPEAEQLFVTVTNFFCSNGSSTPQQSDKGMQSYEMDEENGIW